MDESRTHWEFMQFLLGKLPNLTENQMRALIANPSGVARLLSELPALAITSPKKPVIETPVWKTLVVGGESTYDGCMVFVEENGIEVSYDLRRYFDKSSFGEFSEGSYDLVVLTAGQLEYYSERGNININRVAKDLGLALCPKWLGLELVYQYQDDPGRGTMIFCSANIAGTNHQNYLVRFYYDALENLSLDVVSSRPGGIFMADEVKLVFCKPRSN